MRVTSDTAKEFITLMWRRIQMVDCPPTINVAGDFVRHLTRELGINAVEAEDCLQRLRPTLTTELERRSADWEAAGVPRPAFPSDLEDTYITWKHSKYQDLTGMTPLPFGFAPVSGWLDSLSSQRFLLACAAILKTMGATHIFVTDCPQDEGIDLIARVGEGALASTAIFVQAKCASSPISRDTVLMEYAKYLAMPHTEKYRQYRQALGLDKSVDGVCYCYIIMSNHSFAMRARTISARLGILLRSRAQICYWLTQHTDLEGLKHLELTIGNEIVPDLNRNLASLITFS